MSQYTTIVLEPSDRTATRSPSRVPNIGDTLSRYKRFLGEVAARAAELHQRSAGSWEAAGYPASTSMRIGAVAAIPRQLASQTPTGAATAEIMNVAQNLVATVRAVEGSGAFGELRSALISKRPDVPAFVSNLERAIESGDRLAVAVQSAEITTTLRQVTEIVRGAHKRQAAREIEATERTITASLRQLGYGSIRTVGRDGVCVIRARSAETVVVAEMKSTGVLRIDTAGFHGRECEAAVSALTDQLAVNGLIVKQREATFHGRAEGGELVREGKAVFDPIGDAPAAPTVWAKRLEVHTAGQRAAARRATKRLV
jgi:hypothetical protein